MAIYNVNKDTGDITETAGRYGSSDISANQVTYDNTDSGLTATDVQGAVDELAQSYPADKVMMSDGETSVENKIAELDNNLTASNNIPFRFGYDSTTQKYGYIINEGGADTVIPFKSGNELLNINSSLSSSNNLYCLNLHTSSSVALNGIPCQGYKKLWLYLQTGSTITTKYIAWYTNTGSQIGSTINLSQNAWNALDCPSNAAICGLYIACTAGNVPVFWACIS